MKTKNKKYKLKKLKKTIWSSGKLFFSQFFHLSKLLKKMTELKKSMGVAARVGASARVWARVCRCVCRCVWVCACWLRGRLRGCVVLGVGAVCRRVGCVAAGVWGVFFFFLVLSFQS